MFLRRLIEQERRTAVFVTHDIDEALLLGDRIMVMSARPGRIIANVESPFPAPRDASVFARPEYGVLKTEILSLLNQGEGA
jgi:NitT/TauT family transport system ATP-binding protein